MIWFARIMIVLSFVVLLLVVGTAVCSAAEPHAIVSFNDAEHLAALKDSVIGVCDTSWQLPDNTYIWWRATKAQRVKIYKMYDLPSITCRELVTMTVVKPQKHTKIRKLYDFDSGGVSVDTIRVECFTNTTNCKATPGIAIICWRGVRQ